MRMRYGNATGSRAADRIRVNAKTEQGNVMCLSTPFYKTLFKFNEEGMGAFPRLILIPEQFLMFLGAAVIAVLQTFKTLRNPGQVTEP